MPTIPAKQIEHNRSKPAGCSAGVPHLCAKCDGEYRGKLTTAEASRRGGKNAL